METSDSYNGWTNYETWCVHLWLTNDEYTYRRCQEVIATCDNTFRAADELKETVYDLVVSEDLPASLTLDLITASLDRVDYEEIVRALRED